MLIKKAVLYVSPYRNAQALMRFLLSVHGFKVFSAYGFDDAVAILDRELLDLVLIDETAAFCGIVMVEEFKRIRPHLPMVLWGNPDASRTPHKADVFLSDKTPPRELLDRIKTLVAKKTGPRKDKPLHANT